MSINTVSSRVFNQNVSKAKHAARRGPVFITDRGEPAYVLLTIEQYQKITQQQQPITDLLAMHQADDIDFDPPKMGARWVKPEDFD